jgi:hypothetical protein
MNKTVHDLEKAEAVFRKVMLQFKGEIMIQWIMISARSLPLK